MVPSCHRPMAVEQACIAVVFQSSVCCARHHLSHRILCVNPGVNGKFSCWLDTSFGVLFLWCVLYTWCHAHFMPGNVQMSSSTRQLVLRKCACVCRDACLIFFIWTLYCLWDHWGYSRHMNELHAACGQMKFSDFFCLQLPLPPIKSQLFQSITTLLGNFWSLWTSYSIVSHLTLVKIDRNLIDKVV